MRVLIRLSIILALLAGAAESHAAYNVTISTAGSANGTWSGASPDIWTPDGTGSNVSVADIQTRLATKGVTITTSGAGADVGDLSATSALSWSANKLTLSATRDIRVEAVMTAQGSSSLALITEGTGTVKAGFSPGGGFAGRVDFFLADGVTPRSGPGFLTVNGFPYTVITALGAKGSITGTDLQGINGVLSRRYALGADINASNTSGWNSGLWSGFAPLGNVITADFSGSFDGLGHTVSNLYTSSSDMLIGLFGSTTTPAVIRNVGLLNANVTGGDNVGGLVGVNNFGTISNVFATGTVKGNISVGGLVGSNNLGSISGAYSGCTVTGVMYTGGLVGQAVVDYTGSKSTISNSYATGTVKGTNNYTGGLVGYGVQDSTITNAYASGSVTGTSNVGGLVGYLEASSTITSSYATGTVAGSSLTGGLVGYTDQIVNGTVISSFWDTQTSGKAASAGGTGKTTTEMQEKTTFNAWSIADSGGSTAVWRIYEGQSYPLLRSFLNPLTVTASDAAKTYDGSAYSGGNGVIYAPTGFNASKVLGTLAYGGNSQGATAVGSYSIIPSGLYSSQIGYDISFANGTLTITTPPSYTLDIIFAGAGGNKVESTAPDARINCLKGSSTACSASFLSGPVTLKATPDWKSTFTGLIGGPAGMTNPVTFTLTGNTSVTATFDPILKVKLLPASLFASIQDACDAVGADSTAEIRAQEYVFQEPQGVTIGWDSAKIITLKGGYRPDDVNYDTVTGMTTTVHGPLKIQRGRLNVQGLNIH